MPMYQISITIDPQNWAAEHCTYNRQMNIPSKTPILDSGDLKTIYDFMTHDITFNV